MNEKQLKQLHRLAKLYHVETVFRDTEGRRRPASPQGLWLTLQALGAQAARPEDLAAAIRIRRQQIWARPVEPAAVIWEGRAGGVDIRLPASPANHRIKCRLQLENGAEQHWETALAELTVQADQWVEGRRHQVLRLPLPDVLPLGCHRLTLNWGEQRHAILLLAAPRRAYNPARRADQRTWGIFLPLYALKTTSANGTGNFTHLAELTRWVQQLGGSFTATLPLLAAFYQRPYAPSPYSPASRLFWNEFYLDWQRIPELQDCAPARELIQNSAIQKISAKLNTGPLVDYRREMAVKRSLLELLARHHRLTPSPRQTQLRQWARENPTALQYARFRAAMEYRGTPWPQWPQRMREGQLQKNDYCPDTAHYHLYVQWLAHQQMEALGQTGGLYLDLPLGTHQAGFDTWHQQELFANAVTCGAPPDPLNSRGQNWGFAPLHPQRIRSQDYDYYLAVLRHHMRQTAILRLDHIMGLHRLFWIPQGLAAKDGVYVRYHSQELYALLTLESNRHKVQLVGEDLGTVPPKVRRDMRRHGISRMYILPFEQSKAPGQDFNPVPREALAALGTHDMPPFAGTFAPRDSSARQKLAGFLRRRKGLAGANPQTQALLEESLNFLAASPAHFLLINLEDLWLEQAPQNIPGTTHEYPNWRRRATLNWETFSQKPDILRLLRLVNARRKPKQFG